MKFGAFDCLGGVWKPVGEQKSCKRKCTKSQKLARVTQEAASASRAQGRKSTPGVTQEMAGSFVNASGATRRMISDN